MIDYDFLTYYEKYKTLIDAAIPASVLDRILRRARGEKVEAGQVDIRELDFNGNECPF